MPKKKRQRKPAAKNSRRPGKSPAQLVAAFRSWRARRGLDPDDAWIIDTLLELKRDYLDLPDPRVWPDQETYELLTQVLPRKVLVEDADHDRIAPTLGDFFTFLHQRGSWSTRSLPYEDVPDLIGELTNDMPDMLADPGNRGMAGNLVQFALSQGVDISDEAALAEFMQRFNDKDEDERAAIIATGSPAGPGASPPGAAFGLGPGAGSSPGSAFGLGRGPQHLAMADEEDAFSAEFLDELDDAWPDFLGQPPDEDTVVALGTGIDEVRPILDSVLMTRADQVLDFLAESREVTETGALPSPDTATLAERLGVEGDGQSMWDVPALGVLWSALTVAGFIEISGSIASPSAVHIAWAGPDEAEDARLMAGRLLHLVALDAVLTAPSPESEDASAEVFRAFRHMALLKAATPGGLIVSTPTESRFDAIVDDLDATLEVLAEAGILTQSGDTFYLPPAFLALLPDAVEAMMNEDPEEEP